MRKIRFLLSIMLASLVLNASAHASRVITFFGSGDSETRLGYLKSQPAPANCTLIISNLSAYSQTYTMSFASVAATGTGGASSGSGTYTWQFSDGTNGIFAVPITQTISPGLIHTYVVTFPAMPSGTAGAAQHIDCTGKLSMDDTTTSSPGSLGFSGYIRTVTEEANGGDSSTTAGAGSIPTPHTTPISTSQN